MTKSIHRVLIGAALLICAGCIPNDIPYPVIPINILGVSGEGFTCQEQDIDLKARTVTLHLDEKTDIARVHINQASITEGGSSSVPLVGVHDMRTPLYTTLSLYQDYTWVITAEQLIERRFAVQGQSGASVFDLGSLTITVKVNNKTDLRHIHVTDLKLGPAEITTMSPSLEELTDADFTSMRYLDISYHGVEERWRVYILQTDDVVALSQANLWANTATLSIAPQPTAKSVALNYKLATSTTWLPATTVHNTDGSYTASIAPVWRAETNSYELPVQIVDPQTGVFAGHTYDYQLLVDGVPHPEGTGTFDTAAGDLIPAGDMESSTLSCFTTKNETTDSWGSGNNTFTPSLCTQTTHQGMQGAKAAKLTAKSTLGILAAGNLFLGTFKYESMNGTVGFGQNYTYTARPTALRLKYHAKVGKVDANKYNGPLAIGTQDKARIYICIVDWSTRHGVTSGLSKPKGMWDPETTTTLEGSGQIVGYGSLYIDRSTEGEAMVEVDIPIKFYQRSDSAPQGVHTLIISNSTSAYGDYINGCSSNEMYVDDFRWVY